MVESKYWIFHLVKHTATFYGQSPEEEARTQKEVNDWILAWSPRVRQIIGAHAMGLAGEWDWMGVFAVEEISAWEGFREAYYRRFPGRTEKSLSFPGVGHKEFQAATQEVEHYKKLRELGAFPGGAER